MAPVPTTAAPRARLHTARPVPRTAKAAAPKRSVLVRMKPDIHPEYHESSKVYCNGELVLELGGTKEEYVVDVWSGNHPFYTGGDSNIVLDEGRVTRFANRFGGLDSLSAGVKTLKDDVDKSDAPKGPKVARRGKGKKAKK